MCTAKSLSALDSLDTLHNFLCFISPSGRGYVDVGYFNFGPFLSRILRGAFHVKAKIGQNCLAVLCFAKRQSTRGVAS